MSKCKNLFNLQEINNKFVICPDNYKVDDNYICKRTDIPSKCIKQNNNKSICNPIAYNTEGINYWPNNIEGQPIGGKEKENGKYIRKRIKIINLDNKGEIILPKKLKNCGNKSEKGTGNIIDEIVNKKIKSCECKENCDKNDACNSWEWGIKDKKTNYCFLKDDTKIIETNNETYGGIKLIDYSNEDEKIIQNLPESKNDLLNCPENYYMNYNEFSNPLMDLIIKNKDCGEFKMKKEYKNLSKTQCMKKCKLEHNTNYFSINSEGDCQCCNKNVIIKDKIWEEQFNKKCDDSAIPTKHCKFGIITKKGNGIAPIGSCCPGDNKFDKGTCSTNFLKEMKHINSIFLLKDDGYMKLDSFTIKNLELFSSINNRGIEGTLINTINKTVTSQGERLLKDHIRRPLYNKKRINNRLKLQKDLMKNSDFNDNIRKILKEIGDIERILGKISNNKSNPRDILNLGHSLKINSKINKITPKNVKSIKSLISTSKNTAKISKKILSIIKNEPSINLLKGGYIKNNVNRKLDEYRNISDNVNKWLVDYQIKEQNKTKIPSLKIKYNKVFGYYIDVTKVHLNKIPDNYIRKQTLVNSERYYTVELKEYEEKIISAETKIIDLEKDIYYKLMFEILDNVKSIQINAKILAKIDVVTSHTIIALENHYSKPSFCNKIELNLEKSRHPVVEKLLPLDKEFIDNDLSMKQKNKQIAIITGPNMAGKSTFLRQVGHIIILAQIGSYVPAKLCKLSLVDQLFTRVGASDNISEGESTFLVEMNEAAYILNNATENSFIILDEIGRGTSTFDGLSLAWAITEYIHNNKRLKARTLFATHYHELIYLADELNDAFNLNVKVKEHEDEIIFIRKIVVGGASKSYGIQVAKMAGLPYKVIKRSKVLLKSFMKDKKIFNNQNKENALTQNQLDLFKIDEDIIDELKKINIDELTPMQALNKLNEIKNKYEL